MPKQKEPAYWESKYGTRGSTRLATKASQAPIKHAPEQQDEEGDSLEATKEEPTKVKKTARPRGKAPPKMSKPKAKTASRKKAPIVKQSSTGSSEGEGGEGEIVHEPTQISPGAAVPSVAEHGYLEAVEVEGHAAQVDCLPPSTNTGMRPPATSPGPKQSSPKPTGATETMGSSMDVSTSRSTDVPNSPNVPGSRDNAMPHRIGLSSDGFTQAACSQDNAMPLLAGPWSDDFTQVARLPDKAILPRTSLASDNSTHATNTQAEKVIDAAALGLTSSISDSFEDKGRREHLLRSLSGDFTQAAYTQAEMVNAAALGFPNSTSDSSKDKRRREHVESGDASEDLDHARSLLPPAAPVMLPRDPAVNADDDTISAASSSSLSSVPSDIDTQPMPATTPPSSLGSDLRDCELQLVPSTAPSISSRPDIPDTDALPMAATTPSASADPSTPWRPQRNRKAPVRYAPGLVLRDAPEAADTLWEELVVSEAQVANGPAGVGDAEHQNDSTPSRSSERTTGKRKAPSATTETETQPPKRPKRLESVIRPTRGRPKKLVQPGLVVKLPVSPTSESPVEPADAAMEDAPFEQVQAKPARRRAVQAPKTPRTRKTNGLPTPPGSQIALNAREEVNPDLLKHVDPRLIELSAKLTRRAPLDTKPQPQGQPEVWADSRQALCETVPYFKMPQSGCHQKDGHVYAFLFDGVGHCREYMDSDIIIARAGGGMESDSNGQIFQKKDHEMKEVQVQSVQNDALHHNPLVIICGDKNVGAVTRMPHRYNVLGWYKPMTVWGEKTQGKSKAYVTIKYRFERLGQNEQGAPWHNPTSDVTEHLISDEDRQIAGPLAHHTCDACHTQYPVVFLTGWMCLNPDCKEHFWKLSNGLEAPYGKLPYNPAFLLSRTPWPVEVPPFSVKPLVPDVGHSVGDNLTQINTRGICCPQCGRCSSRRLFKGWRCDNPQCSYERFPKHIPVKIPQLHQPWESTGEGPALARNQHQKCVHLEVSYVAGFKVNTYTFEGVQGKLVHAITNNRINREPRGADEMFEAIQSQDKPEMDMHLERRRFGAEKMSGIKIEAVAPISQQAVPALLQQASPSAILQNAAETLATSQTALFATPQHSLAQQVLGLQSPPQSGPSNGVTPPYTEKLNQPIQHTGLGDPPQKAEAQDGDFMTAFSMNYGMPYKFVASGASMSFEEAPWPVRACRADLNWASRTFLDPAGHMDLNEELIFAYMEGQKLEYHDDGESGLGPRIATLSLGGKAKMHLRMKSKHYVGCSKGTGILTADRPVPGSIDGPEMYEKRLAAWERLQVLKETNKQEYEKQRKQLPKDLGLFEKKGKMATDLVTITLNHGDIVLMDGYEIQQYLEHKVVPENCLRFAMTCRTVLPEHLRADELPAYDVKADDESMSGLRKMAERVQAARQQPQQSAQQGSVEEVVSTEIMEE